MGRVDLAVDLGLKYRWILCVRWMSFGLPSILGVVLVVETVQEGGADERYFSACDASACITVGCIIAR